MIYSEAAYFHGAHVAHIAAWQDYRRIIRLSGLTRSLHQGSWLGGLATHSIIARRQAC